MFLSGGIFWVPRRRQYPLAGGVPSSKLSPGNPVGNQSRRDSWLTANGRTASNADIRLCDPALTSTNQSRA